MDQHQQITWHPKPSLDCGNFTLDLKQRGFCASPLFLQTLGPWFPKEMQNLLSSENITLDHSAAVQSRRFWRCLLFKSGLTQECDSWNPCLAYVWCVVGSWSTDSSCSPLFVNLPHIFEWVFVSQSSPGCGYPYCLYTFFYTQSFPSLRPSINVLGDRALWTASLFCNDLLCLALLLQGVNGPSFGQLSSQQSSPWLCSLQN